MALQSQLFRGDSNLEAAAVSDPGHILPGARGTHVGKIQQAIIQLDGASIAQDSSYGPGTAAAVSAFKRKRGILNFAGQIDNIVGKKTMAALDSEMLAKERGGPPAPLPPGPLPIRPTLPGRRLPTPTPPKVQPPGGGGQPTNTPAFQVVPFTETAPFLISQQKDSRTEDDLEFTKREPKGVTLGAQIKVAAARSIKTGPLELEMLAELSAGGQIGRDMGNIFIRNQSVQVIPFVNDSPLSKAIRNSSRFPGAQNKVRDEITTVFKATIASRRVVDFHDLAAANNLITPPVFPFGLVSDRKLKFAIGGMKGVDLFISKFDASDTPRRWSATLIYNFIDHFGINDSDLILDTSGHGSPGQVGMWVMQHERHPGHFPFISRITVISDIQDTL